MTGAQRRAVAMRGIGLGLGALVALACGSSPQAEVSRAASPPEGVLIQNVAVLDVASGARQGGRDVLLRDGKIAANRPTGSADADGARVVDGKGATLVPGLIDMHGHVNTGTQPTWEFGFPDAEKNLTSYLYAGVTTVHDPADGSAEAYERRERAANGGLVAPRIYTSGKMITCTDGHPIAMVREFVPGWLSWWIEGQIAEQVGSSAAAQEAVDRLAEQGADMVKIAVDRIPLDAPRMEPDLIAAVVERAREHGLRTVAHVGTTQDAIDAGDAGVALWVHAVYQDRVPDGDLAKLAGYGIPVVATIEVFNRYARSGEGPIAPNRIERETVPKSVLDSFFPVPDDFDLGNFGAWLEALTEKRHLIAENTVRMRRAGITVLAGSDTQSGVFAGAGLHRELAQLVAAGLSPSEAIRAATFDAARYIANGEPIEFGSVEVGLRADLLLVEGDPTQDVSRLQDIRQLFLGGVPIERTPVPSGV